MEQRNQELLDEIDAVFAQLGRARGKKLEALTQKLEALETEQRDLEQRIKSGAGPPANFGQSEPQAAPVSAEKKSIHKAPAGYGR